MLDMLSDCDMPTLEERVASLTQYAKQNNFTVTPERIMQICKETPDYSYTGYIMGGKMEEQNKLKK